MHCCYINLDQATQRKESIESSFEKAARPGWTLSRFRALDTAFVDAHGIQGRRSRAEKACFLSHKAVIETYADDGKHLLVLEDDSLFGLATCEIVDGFLQQNPGGDWDLLFLDACVINVGDMLTLYFHRQALVQDRKIIPLDLSRIPFFGTSSYIVNAASRDKVLACINAGIPIDIEYDVYLANQISTGKLKAAVLFPFLTTISAHAAESQIQRSSMDTVNRGWNLFRNMMWLESKPESCQDSLRTLEAAVANSGHGALATILAAQFMNVGDPGSNSDPD
jgi:GR25 family glycosyltransferase involved in LPS biosynthesis